MASVMSQKNVTIRSAIASWGMRRLTVDFRRRIRCTWTRGRRLARNETLKIVVKTAVFTMATPVSLGTSNDTVELSTSTQQSSADGGAAEDTVSVPTRVSSFTSYTFKPSILRRYALTGLLTHC